jgi:uncharacterized membrane protein
MATLTAWKFDTPEGADAAEQTLIAPSKRPVLRAVAGHGSGRVGTGARRVSHRCRDRRRVHRVGARQVTPGTSALFVPSSDAVLDKVRDAFAGQHPELIHTNLSGEEEAKLREVFAE